MTRRKLFLLLNMMAVGLVISADSVFSQTQKTVKKKAKQTSKSSAPMKWKTVSIEKWGIENVALPENAVKQEEGSEPQKNNDVTWTENFLSWREKSVSRVSFPFEVRISVTEWDADFAKVTGLQPAAATPENLISLDVEGDRRNTSVEESEFYRLDDVPGGFFLASTAATMGGSKNRITLGWFTYRYFNNKAQRISLTATGPRNKRQILMKITDSLRLKKE